MAWSKRVKERLGRSAAEMIYGTTLRLLGEFKQQYTVDANTDLENYSDKLRLAMSRLRLCPPRDTHQKNIFQYKEIETCTHVFLRRIAIAPPLTGPYDGPVKPPHLECEPTTCPTTQRTKPSKKQSSKTTRIPSGNPQDPSRPSRANTRSSSRTSVKQTQSTAVRKSTKLVTVPQ